MESYDKYDSMSLSLHINFEKKGFFSFPFFDLRKMFSILM